MTPIRRLSGISQLPLRAAMDAKPQLSDFSYPLFPFRICPLMRIREAFRYFWPKYGTGYP